ncbi:hypothetical protein CBL_01374 [Carabus blaptoides fortunei]
MHFSLIFAGRRGKEAIILSTQILSIVKSFFIHTDSFVRKVCCLYIMYGIFYKQPFLKYSKILVTMPEWKHILEFIKVVQDNNHFDTFYIILKLIGDNAFELSAFQAKRMNMKRVHNYTKDIAVILPTLKDSKIQGMLKDLQIVGDSYEKAKMELAESRNLPEIKYCDNDISKYIQDIIDKDETDDVEPSSPIKEQENIIDRRKALRQKCFKRKSEPPMFKSVKFMK